MVHTNLSALGIGRGELGWWCRNPLHLHHTAAATAAATATTLFSSIYEEDGGAQRPKSPKKQHNGPQAAEFSREGLFSLFPLASFSLCSHRRNRATHTPHPPLFSHQSQAPPLAPPLHLASAVLLFDVPRRGQVGCFKYTYGPLRSWDIPVLAAFVVLSLITIFPPQAHHDGSM